MKQNGVPKVVSSVAFIFMAFYPAIPMMAQTMTKDTLHAWILALFYLGYIETIRTSGENVKNLRFDMAGILVMLLLFFLFSNMGLWISAALLLKTVKESPDQLSRAESL